MNLAALALLLAASPAFRFENVQPWRWSDGRQERIPALSATIENLSGDDWAEARFKVTVACSQGGSREYTVLLRDVLLGSQQVQATAFDAIGSVEACEGPAAVEFTGGRKYEEGQRPAYVLFGFSYREGDGPASGDLAGILDYRRHSDSGQETHTHSVRDHARRIELPGYPHAGFYCLRVEPGTLGLAGFLLNPGDHSAGPLSRFLRFFDVPPGAISYLGIFELRRGPGRLYSVTMDAGLPALAQMPVIASRPIHPAPATRPAAMSNITIAQ